MLEFQELISTGINIEILSEKEGMSSDNCNVYGIEIKSGNLQCQEGENMEVEKNENDKRYDK